MHVPAQERARLPRPRIHDVTVTNGDSGRLSGTHLGMITEHEHEHEQDQEEKKLQTCPLRR
jgi:hypothetical protein